MPFAICFGIVLGILLLLFGIYGFLEWITKEAPIWVENLFGILFISAVFGLILWAFTNY